MQNGKTEYKSITYSYDATAEEFTDLYFDDDFRPKWVSSGARAICVASVAGNEHRVKYAQPSCQ